MRSKAEMEKAAEQPLDEMKKLRFHNYVPRTEDLKKYYEESAESDTMLRKISEAQDETLREANRKFGDPALDLDHMVSRKGNWDIQRSLSSKFERLEQRTRRAIIEIVRQKQTDSGKPLRVDDERESISSGEMD